MNSTNPKLYETFVGGVSSKSTKHSLSQYFSQFGKIVSISLTTCFRTRNTAFICFQKQEDFLKCIANRYQKVDGKKVEVRASLT